VPLFRISRGALDKRDRSLIIFLVEPHFSDSVGRGTGKLTLPVVIQHALKTGPSCAGAVESTITFRQVEIGARSTGNAGILTQVFFVFRRRQVIELSGRQRVRVTEWSLVRRVGLG